MIVGSGETGRVVPDGARLEFARIGPEQYLDLPARPGDILLARHEAACATVPVLSRKPVHWRRGAWRMTKDAEVELDAAGKPRSAHCDVAELHHVVGIEEIALRDLVVGTPDLLVVLQDYRLPHPVLRLVRGTVIAEIRIAPLCRSRHGIGVVERICLERLFRKSYRRSRHFLFLDPVLLEGEHRRIGHG